MENNGQAAPAAAPVPATPATQTKIDEIDHLRAENIYLKLDNYKLQIQIMDLQKEKAGLKMLELQGQMRELSQELSVKYQVPLTDGTVKADGTILRKPVPHVALPQVIPQGTPLGTIAPGSTKVTA